MRAGQENDSSRILAVLSSDEMKQYLTAVMETNEDVRRHFIATFSAKIARTLVDFKAIITNSIRPLALRHGFVHPSRAQASVRPVSQLIEVAHHHLSEGELETAIMICQAVIEKLVPAFQTIDDSSGILSGLVDAAFEILETVPLHEPPEAVRFNLFTYSVKSATKKAFDGWDAEWRFANLAADLAIAGEERKLVSLTVAMRKRDTGSEWIEQFTAEQAARVLLHFFMRTRPIEFTEKFIEENLRFPSFRRTAISQAMRKRDFNKAISLAEDGVRLARDQDLPGLVTQFNQELLTIHREQGNKAGVVRMAEVLFQDSRYTLTYYDVLREAMEAEEWTRRRPEFLEKITKEGDRRSLAAIYSADRDYPKLMSTLEEYGQLESLKEHEDHLLPEYKERLQQLYFRIIAFDLDQHPNRKTYRVNANILGSMLKKYDQAIVKDFSDKLSGKYKMRPALIEELRRVGM